MSAEFISKTKTLKMKTKGRLDFITITSEVEEFIEECNVECGSVVIQTLHTTCGIWVNENEKNLIGPSKELGYTNDIKMVLDRFADPKEEYHHNDIKDDNNPNGKRNTHLCEINSEGEIPECINGHAHAQATIIQSSISMIIENSKLLKGEWQEIMLVELDHDRERGITILVQGNKKE